MGTHAPTLCPHCGEVIRIKTDTKVTILDLTPQQRAYVAREVERRKTQQNLQAKAKEGKISAFALHFNLA